MVDARHQWEIRRPAHGLDRAFTVYVVAPDKKIRLMISYPMTTGRNFDEILRVIDSLQLTSAFKVAAPVNWRQGEDVIIVPSVDNTEAGRLFPDDRHEIKPYLRITKYPRA